jgi:hypothetical protein
MVKPKTPRGGAFSPMIDRDRCSNLLWHLEALEKLAGVDDPQDGHHNAYGQCYVVKICISELHGGV